MGTKPGPLGSGAYGSSARIEAGAGAPVEGSEGDLAAASTSALHETGL